jgi:hypothetical protein
MGRKVKGMASFELLSVISKDLRAECFKAHAFQESSRNNPVGIDVITPQDKGAAFNLGNQAFGKIVGLRHEGSKEIKQQQKTERARDFATTAKDQTPSKRTSLT